MIAGGLLSRLAAKLDAAGIPYMITGSFASTYHGTTRTTHDIDVVIDADRAALETLVRSFPDDEYYVDLDAALDALAHRSQFNVIDLATGWKADLIVRKDREFSRAELARREPAEILGARVFVATAEDTIVSKLEWAKIGESERQLRDVAGILDVRRGRLDLEYVERWVRELGLEEVWSRARSG